MLKLSERTDSSLVAWNGAGQKSSMIGVKKKEEISQEAPGLGSRRF